jgi:non-ribosomal peptide synthetase component E (peptide arylation enzyme)
MDCRLIELDGLKQRPVREWHERGWWGRTPLWQRVRETAVQQPSKTAIFDAHTVTSYSALWKNALRIVVAMQGQGLEKRDVVLVQLPNWHEFVVLAVGAETAGVVFAFCPIQWGLRETALALRLIKPKIWCTTRYSRQGDDRALLIQSALQELGGFAPAVILVRSDAIHGVADTLDNWLNDLDVDVNMAVNGGRGSDPLPANTPRERVSVLTSPDWHYGRASCE